MKRVLLAVVAVVICACGLNQYSDPYGQNPYGNGPQMPQQQQPRESVKEHATFKVESTEKVFGPNDGSKITECRYEKSNNKIYMGVQFVSADGNSSMKISIPDLEENRVSATWKSDQNSGKEVTLVTDLRNKDPQGRFLSRFSTQSRTYTADCTIYYELEAKLLRVRYFSCTGLQNGTGQQYTGSGEFACYLKDVNVNNVR